MIKPLAKLLAVAVLCALAARAVAAEPDRALGRELDGMVDLLDADYAKRPIDVRRLPLRYAVTVVHGRGARTVYAFEDPRCRYCRELARHLADIGDVTVHTFVVPLLGGVARRRRRRLCAQDRRLAWRTVMRGGALPRPPGGCRAPHPQTLELAELLGIRLTPTLGSRLNGVRSWDEIAARLRQAAEAKAAKRFTRTSPP